MPQGFRVATGEVHADTELNRVEILAIEETSNTKTESNRVGILTSEDISDANTVEF